METRHQKKRGWQSMAEKKARVELDFGQNTPSPKRIKLSTPSSPEDTDSFTIKSFYGKREKISFPHSPGRRKAVDKVLDKISDENTDSEQESLNKKKKISEKKIKIKSNSSRFDFTSSESTDTENEGRGRKILLPKTMDQNNRKAPLKFVKSRQTPKNNSKKVLASSTGKVPNRVKELTEKAMTPRSTGKKFFKSRSPASADKCFGNLVIKKGFDLKFYPKRLDISKISKSEKRQSKSSSKKTRAKSVDQIKATAANPFLNNEVFYVEDKKKSDGTENYEPSEAKQVSVSCDNNEQVVTPKNEKSQNKCLKEKSDSGIGTENSNDLFSSISENNAECGTCSTDSVTGKENSEGESETVSLIGAGSDDLFLNSGRSTPQNEKSGEVTPDERTPSQSKQNSPTSSSDSSAKGSESQKQARLFPIFMKQSPKLSSQLDKLRGKGSPTGSNSPRGSPLLKYVRSRDNMEQMIIDAGQSRFGATQCEVCGMVYSMAEPADETTHHKFHQSFLSTLKFAGWKKEHVVQEYMDTGSRVILITSDSPKYAIKKVDEISKIMEQELGFPEPNNTTRCSFKTFLFISEDRKIEGCCVTEPVSVGYRVLPDTGASQAFQNHPGHRPWCCSDKPEPAVVGVSRIWVYSRARRKGVATRLLDCVRQWSVYGTVISKDKMAFSDPTPDGKQLASRYIGRPDFLVYKYH